MTHTHRTKKGFTLIETIAAVVILSVAIPPMVWAVGEAHHQRVNPVLASRARWLAVEKLENIIADRHGIGYSHLIPGNYSVEDPVLLVTGTFKRTVTLTETEADLSTAGTGYMVVDVDVEWTDSFGETRTLTISTVLTDYVP